MLSDIKQKYFDKQLLYFVKNKKASAINFFKIITFFAFFLTFFFPFYFLRIFLKT